MLPFSGTTVVITHPAITTDAYNNRARSYSGGGVTTTVSPAQVQPAARVGGASSGEDQPNSGRDQVVTRYRIFLPAGTPVGPQDRIAWNGLTLDVVGDPASWPSPSGAGHHIEVFAVAAAG